mgnify:CR=1 FL=1|eukprot:SAG11_NODE_84_length_17377_cov_78.572578_7_plen_138_part_00
MLISEVVSKSRLIGPWRSREHCLARFRSLAQDRQSGLTARKDMMERVTREDARVVCNDPQAVKRFQVRQNLPVAVLLVIRAYVKGGNTHSPGLAGSFSLCSEESAGPFPNVRVRLEQHWAGEQRIDTWGAYERKQKR